MFCVRGHRDPLSDSLRPLRRHRLVVRTQQGKTLGLPWGEAETGVVLLRQAAAIKLITLIPETSRTPRWGQPRRTLSSPRAWFVVHHWGALFRRVSDIRHTSPQCLERPCA